MKVFGLFSIILAVTICTVSAEPPRNRGRAAYAAPAPAPATEAPVAPYPPSGWKPSGRQFNLPTRQAAPQDAYAAPPKEKYGPPTPPPPPPPSAEYGPVATEAPVTTELPTTTEDVMNTTEETTEDLETDTSGDGSDVDATNAQQTQQDLQKSGVYYVLLPNGRLQRVAYTTSRNQQVFQQLNAPPAPINPGYLAIQYQDVQPIQGPIYSYESSPFVRLYN